MYNYVLFPYLTAAAAAFLLIYLRQGQSEKIYIFWYL